MIDSRDPRSVIPYYYCLCARVNRSVDRFKMQNFQKLRKLLCLHNEILTRLLIDDLNAFFYENIRATPDRTQKRQTLLDYLPFCFLCEAAHEASCYSVIKKNENEELEYSCAGISICPSSNILRQLFTSFYGIDEGCMANCTSAQQQKLREHFLNYFEQMK